MKKKQIVVIIFILSLAATLVLYSLFYTNPIENWGKGDPPKYGGTYIHPIPANLDYSLDPRYTYEVNPQHILTQVFSTLLKSGKDMNLKPNVCQSWYFENKQKTFVCNIRQGIKFHNGKNLTSNDVYFSLHFLATPNNRRAMEFGSIVGIKEFWNGQVNAISGIKKEGSYKISITTTTPSTNFIYFLTHPSNIIMPRGLAELPIDIFFNAPIGSGPFKFKSQSNEILTLEAFKDYFLGKPYIDTLIFKKMTPMQAYAAFNYDEVHDLLPFIYDDKQLKGVKDAKVIKTDNLLSLILLPNIKAEPFNKFENRLLLLKKLNLDKIYDSCSIKQVRSIIPYSIGGYISNYVYPNNKLSDKQSEYLKNALPPAIFYYPDLLENYCLVNEIKNTLNSSGLPFTNKLTNFDEMEKFNKNGAPMHLYIDGIVLSTSDASSILKFFYSKTPQNINGVSDPEIDKLYELAKDEANLETKYKLYQTINKILLDKIYAIPLLQQQQVDIFKNNIQLVEREYPSKYLLDFSTVWIK